MELTGWCVTFNKSPPVPPSIDVTLALQAEAPHCGSRKMTQTERDYWHSRVIMSGPCWKSEESYLINSIWASSTSGRERQRETAGERGRIINRDEAPPPSLPSPIFPWSGAPKHWSLVSAAGKTPKIMINRPINQRAVQRSEESVDLLCLSFSFFTEGPTASKCADLHNNNNTLIDIPCTAATAVVIALDLYSNQPAEALRWDSLYIVLFHFTANKWRGPLAGPL